MQPKTRPDAQAPEEPHPGRFRAGASHLAVFPRPETPLSLALFSLFSVLPTVPVLVDVLVPVAVAVDGLTGKAQTKKPYGWDQDTLQEVARGLFSAC
jgi:hypothetical protein